MLAASCGLSRDPSGGTAATVTFPDGSTQEISTSLLDEFYDSIEDDEDFSIAAFGAAGIPPGLQSSILSDMIIGTVLDNLLKENNASPSDENLADGTTGLEQTIAGFFPADDDPVATARGRFETLPYLGFLAGLQAKQAALGDALIAANSSTIEAPCVSHILVETEEEANDLVALLDDGGDFAELAIEFSTGPSGPEGGVLGCSDPSRFVPEFSAAVVDAPIGTIIGPVQTDFGFHVITVTAIEEQAVGGSDPQSLVGAELLSAMSQIEVDVDPLLGEWDGAQGAVIPPG